MKKIFIFLWVVGLWVEGFGQQATMVKEFAVSQSDPESINHKNLREIIPLGNKVIFTADNKVNGQELWISEGTDKGTLMLKNIASDSLYISHSSPSNFKRVNNNLVVFTATSKYRDLLYRTDGTEKGTFAIGDSRFDLGVDILSDTTIYWLQDDKLILKDYNKLGYKTIIDRKVANDVSKFYIDDDVSRIPLYFLRFRDKWLFNAKTISGDYALYISDGTPVNTTKLLSSFRPIPIVKSQTVNGMMAFFIYGDDSNGQELWITDGSKNGTKIVKDIFKGKSGAIGVFGKEISVVKNGVIFRADDSTSGESLWFSDGTESGTKLIKDFAPNVRSFNDDFFYINDIEGTGISLIYQPLLEKLWRTDGTLNGTKLITTGYISSLSLGLSLINDRVKGYVFFTKINSITARAELFALNIENNDLKLVYNFGLVPFGIENYAIAEQKLYFRKINIVGYQLWKVDIPLCNHTAKINTPNGTSFCTGSSITISGEASGTTNPFTYKWKQGTSDAGTVTNLTVNKAGTYTLEVTDSGGCTVSTTVDITQTANLPISISGTNNFCVGQNTTLTATATGGVAPITYQWKQGSSNVGTNANTFSVTSAGTYSVGVTDKNGCIGTSTVYSVTQKPSPNVTITKSGSTDLLPSSSVVLSVPTASGQTYQWSKNGVAIAGATNNSYTVNSAGSYTVTVIGNGCSATSEAVVANIVTAIEEEPNSSEIQLEVSPNPTEGVCKVKIDLLKPSKVSLQLRDMTGRNLQEQTLSNPSKHHETTLDFSKYADGVYLLQVSVEGKSVVKKVVRQN